MIKPIAIDEEYEIEPYAHIVSKTDKSGKIVYANDMFSKVSGYTKEELDGKSHNITRHPDMPKVIFKLMWERILAKKNIIVFIKNLRKDGKYYWVITDFEIITDNNGNIKNFYAYRKIAPKQGVEKISKLYTQLLEIEETKNLETSSIYLEDFLKEKKLTYDEYVNSLLEEEGLIHSWFTSVTKIFKEH